MKLLVVGCSFRTAPLALRERLAFPASELPHALKKLHANPDLEEVLLLSTCNRVEVWAASHRPSHGHQAILRFLTEERELSEADIDTALYAHLDEEAVRHIFRVTSSLDALVVGEAQIAGQVKEAFAAASRARSTGPLLNRCMHRAFGAAKRVRTETGIARHPVSVSSVAADLARRVFGDLASATVLVLGAGEMAELAVRHLIADGATDVRVLNRTFAHAVSLAFQLGAKARPFEELPGQLLLADILISSTGSPTPIIDKKLVAEVMRQRKQRPLFIVDIAVPRDVDKSVGDLSNVYRFDVDDLEQVVAENLKARRKEARQAEALLAVEVAHFLDWLKQQDAVPIIKELRRQFTEVVRAETQRCASELNLQGERQQRMVETLSEAIVNKLLHAPSLELKTHAARSDGRFLAQAARHLFHLPLGDDGQPIGSATSVEETHAQGADHRDPG